jgi:hypothetical protein
MAGLRGRTQAPQAQSAGGASDMLAAVTRTHMMIVSAFFGAAFAISGIVRGDVAPGLVGGVLGAVLVYLLLQRVHEHNEAMRRRRDREERPR